MRVAGLILAVLALSGCSQIAESRMEDTLVDAGLPPQMAGCMAERMSDRLTFNQMRKLTRLQAEGDEERLRDQNGWGSGKSRPRGAREGRRQAQKHCFLLQAMAWLLKILEQVNDFGGVCIDRMAVA